MKSNKIAKQLGIGCLVALCLWASSTWAGNEVKVTSGSPLQADAAGAGVDSLMGAVVASGTVLAKEYSPAEDFDYSIESGTVKIIGYKGLGGAVAIPPTLENLPVTTIGEGAFHFCNELTSIEIPASVTLIEKNAFQYCHAFESITVAEGNPNYSSLDGILFDKNRTTLILCPGMHSGDYGVPQGVTTIGDQAFVECQRLTSIVLPEGVTTIGNSAFECCQGLTSIEMPDSVTSIGIWAFFYCESLTSIIIPAGVTLIGDSTFGSCSNLASIYFKGNAPELGSYVFSNSSPTLYYVEGTEGWTNPWGGQPTATWVPENSQIKIDPKPVVDPETGKAIGFNLTYPTGSVLEMSTDLIQWEEVTEATGGTYLVRTQGATQRYFRYRK